MSKLSDDVHNAFEECVRLRRDLAEARTRIAELECWANSYSGVRAHVNMAKELAEANAKLERVRGLLVDSRVHVVTRAELVAALKGGSNGEG